jgi:uncharacterized membrane protein YfcA
MSALSIFGAAAAGLVAGVISGWGVGGGTLLLIYLIHFLNTPQQVAQGTNLLYFLPTSSTALFFHIKNGLIEKKVAIPAIIGGAVTAFAAALVATSIEMGLLRKFFGGFLILVGISELFKKSPKKAAPAKNGGKQGK